MASIIIIDPGARERYPKNVIPDRRHPLAVKLNLSCESHPFLYRLLVAQITLNVSGPQYDSIC